MKARHGASAQVEATHATFRRGRREPSSSRHKRRVWVARSLTAPALLALALLATAAPAPALAADGPNIMAYSPPTGLVDVSPDIRPWLKFTEPIDQSTVTDATLYVQDLYAGPGDE